MHQPGEPSVEEILDSIKKVIARDTRAATMDREDERIEPSDEDEADEVLELAEDEMISPPEDYSFENEHSLIEGSEQQEEYGPWFEPRADDEGRDDRDSYAIDDSADEGLTSAEVRSSLQQNFATLAMLSEPGQTAHITRSGETSLEGLTRELLRPMLAQWLDENLPGMVEKLVKAEIARIAGKRG